MIRYLLLVTRGHTYRHPVTIVDSSLSDMVNGQAIDPVIRR